MSIKRALAVISNLAKEGVIKNYAITGAVAALNYIEPTLTEDVDVLVSLEDFGAHASGLLLLGPLEEALAKRGYSARSDVGVIVEDWPVQFIPVASPLDEEALREAIDVQIDGDQGTSVRMLRPEHVVAKAISIGRFKDLSRAEAFLDQNAVDLDALRALLRRFGLDDAWRTFCIKAGRTDPLR